MSIKKQALTILQDGIQYIPASVLREIKKSPDVMRGETIEEMWLRTAKELSPSLIASIRKNGVREPLLMNEGWLVDGHNRVLAGMQVNPDMLLPVKTNVGFKPSTYRIKPSTPDERLFAEYLASSRFSESPENIKKLLDRYGYDGLMRSAQDNDSSWFDFKDVYKGML